MLDIDRINLTESREELAALRLNLRRERVDLEQPGLDTVLDPEDSAALRYARWQLRLADVALSTALEALRTILTDDRPTA